MLNIPLVVPEDRPGSSPRVWVTLSGLKGLKATEPPDDSCQEPSLHHCTLHAHICTSGFGPIQTFNSLYLKSIPTSLVDRCFQEKGKNSGLHGERGGEQGCEQTLPPSSFLPTLSSSHLLSFSEKHSSSLQGRQNKWEVQTWREVRAYHILRSSRTFCCFKIRMYLIMDVNI